MTEPTKAEFDQFDPLETAREVERRLDLAPGFFDHLYNEDDWSFVVKLHALIEATVTHAVVVHLERPELEEPISRLALADQSSSKLAFAKALDCIGESDRRFIRRLAEIRNKFVHDVRNVGRSLEDYVRQLDKNQFAELVKVIGPGQPMELRGRTITEADFVRWNPKLATWTTAMYVLAGIELGIQTKGYQLDVERMERDFAVEMRSMLSHFIALTNRPSPSD